MKTKTPYVKLLRLFLFFSFLTNINLAFGQRQNLLLEATFEGTNPFGSPLSLAGQQYCCSYSLTQSTAQARAGTSSMKIDLRKTDPIVSSSVRAEVEDNIGTPTESERWYGGSWFLSNWGPDSFGESIFQFHDDDGTGPPLALEDHDGHLYLRRLINGGSTEHDLGLISDIQNTWADIVLHVKWTYATNSGLIQCWVNGVQKVNISNIRTNSNGCYMKLGMNKWNWAPGGGSSNQTQRIFYIDEFRVGNANATYADVAPSSTTPPPNQPPVANAGNDITMTLPVNSTTLVGSGTDPDGTIAGYAWTRVSGPTTFTLGTANAATTTLSNLVAGTYVFSLKVTDNNGATATDNVTVTVNAAINQPPVANAGSDVTITLPTNSTSLTGSGTDPDGTIASYAWTRVSGPTTFTLGTANAAVTTLSNLVLGTYVFRLTVTDNNGATGTDNMTVIVLAAPNLPPTANAGSDITMTLPVNSTTLNGSGTDPDGTIAGYAWSRVSGPTTFTLGTANAATTTLSNLVAGIYVFRLTVTDNGGATATDNVTVTVNAAVNQPPIASAGSDITLILPVNSTTLNGSGTDPDGTIAGYVWSRVSGPTTFTLGTANAATTTLSNLVQGIYTFRLTVTDNNGATGTDDVIVTVNAAANLPPTANAGSDITLTLSVNSTTLNGSGTDPDGTIAGYAWTRVSGPATYTLGTANAATTTLSNLVAGIYVFSLTVTDNNGATATDNVTVTVNAAVNQPPTASAGSDITLTLPVNSTTLNGSGTDPDGTITGYAWTRISGPATYTLGTANAATTTLSNLVQGVYTFRLTVTDNSGATATDDVIVTVNAAANLPPVANAGNNIVITLPANSTTLTGSGSDPDGTITSYAWTYVSGPATYTLANANAATTGLNNLVQGVYTFRLTVTDNSGATATDDVIVTVNAAANQPPTANAGNNIVITLPANSTTLTGSGSDPDGTITSYAWTYVSGPATYTLANANAATTGLNNLVQGVYTFRLTVTDNSGATATDDVIVTVNASAPSNQAPIAIAGNNITLNLPANTTTLNGTSSFDPDGTIVSYAWTRVSGPATYTLANANAATTGLSNLVAGTYVFQLTVTDNNGATDDDNITVIVSAIANQPPVANAGNNIIITLPLNSTNLNGGSSVDPDGTIVSYAWARISGPATYTIANANAAATGLSNLVQGVYTFRLTVTDNDGATSTDDVTVTVNPAPNQAPTANAGTDVTLTLPINSTILTGSGYDPDGTIASYAWSRISGPATFVLVNASAASTGLNGLVQGIYVFRLTVTDNSGATATDDVTITVNAATPPPNQAPTANAGTDVTLTLPINSTILAGSGYDPDGTIASYAWSRVSGPATFVLVNASAASTGLNGLVQGVYVFRLTVTDNSGATATDNVTITVNAATPPANQAPTANAGTDVTLTLPINSTILTGSGYDPDGTIAGYAWSRVSGPATFVLVNASAASTGLNGLVQGVYVFRLTVTDNNGATATDDVTITVNAATAPPNQPPTANAGSDITLVLPVNSTILTGSGFDPDGTITGYAWSWVSGPATFALVNANAASTGLNNLVQGVYVFKLTVTDNNGATATDNVTVTVSPANNQSPTANAGSDITLTLPVNSTTLFGSGSDPDGSIAAYAWSRVSGPTTFALANASAATTGLSNLVQGVYVFRLTVTDNRGATATDNITVTVNATLPTTNQPPTARSYDIVLTLPVNAASLDGSSSSDPDGVIAAYQWRQISGPTQVTINNSSAAVADIADLTTGEYVFELKVTDNNGATSVKAITVTVQNKSGQGAFFIIYPNPTSDVLNMKYVETVNGKIRVSIYDMSRKLIRDEIIDKNQVTLTKTIDVSLLEAGVYLIEIISSDNERIVKQFVKM
jgi:ribosomal protein L14